MVETESKDEPMLPSKRKLGSLSIFEDHEEENQSSKYQNLQFLAHNDIIASNEEKATPSINSGSNFSVGEEKNCSKAQAEKNAVREEEEEEEEEETDFEDEEEEENVKAASVADRKGKGIMIEEEDDDSDADDSDESSDGGSEVDSDCNELEDDPLAEVDLDNILPSRTRRKALHSGFYTTNDLGKNQRDGSDV